MRSPDRLLSRLRRSEVRAALRIGSWITLLVALQAFLLFAFVAREYQEEAEQDLGLHAEWVAAGMSARSEAFVTTMADLGAREGLGARRVARDGSIRDVAGRWPSENEQRHTAAGPWSGLWLMAGAEQYLLQSSNLADGDLVEVALSLDRYVQELREIRNGLIGILALSLVGALAVGWLATRRSFAPLRAATQALAALDAGALQTRLLDRGTGDFLDEHAAVLNAALERIAAAVAQLRSFSADVAHELRTPVNRIAAIADASLLVEDSADRSREAIHQITESARGLAAMIDALLLLAQLEEGRQPLANAPIAVRPWLEGLVSLYRPACSERHIAITDRIDDLVVSGERCLLDRAVCNLLDNAISHGGRDGSIEVTANERADGVEIAIADAGPGISESDRRRVFDRFVRVDPARSSPGTGIGLSLAFAIARAHGGTLRVETSRLGGARFVLSIPAVAIKSSDTERQARDARGHIASAIGVPIRALDDKELLFSLEDMGGDLSEISADEARNRALLVRSDVLAALARFDASEAALRLELAKQYPDVHLGNGFQFDQGQRKWILGLSLELPILNRNQGGIAQADASRREAAAAFFALQAQILGDLERTLSIREAARNQVIRMADLVTAQGLAFRRTEDALALGAVDRLAVWLAKIERARARLLWVDALGRFQQTLGELEAAVQTSLPSSGVLEPGRALFPGGRSS